MRVGQLGKGSNMGPWDIQPTNTCFRTFVAAMPVYASPDVNGDLDCTPLCAMRWGCHSLVRVVFVRQTAGTCTINADLGEGGIRMRMRLQFLTEVEKVTQDDSFTAAKASNAS